MAVTLHFIIPFAPVSVNDAYGIRSVATKSSSYAFKYLQPHYRKLKEVMTEVLASQDTGEDVGPYLRVEYLFLYVSEEIFIQKGSPNTIKAESGRLIQDPDLYRKDVSNSFKLVEDALFDYFRKDDTRSIDVVGYKRACKALPVQVESYTGCQVDMPKGVILIRVEALEEGAIFLRPGDPVYKRFQPSLDDTSFEEEDRETVKSATMTFPEWYAPGESPDSGIDMVEDSEVYRRSSAREQNLIIRDMIARRIRFACEALAIDESDVAEMMLRGAPLRKAYRQIAPKGVRNRDQIAQLCATDEWALAQLRLEATETFAEKLRAVEWMCSSLLREGQSALVVGAGAGGILYPFVSRNVEVTATEIRGAVHTLLKSRAARDHLPIQTRSVSWYDRMKGMYDAIIAFGVLDIEPELFSLLGTLRDHLRVGGFLVTDCTFKRHAGKKLAFPWVQDAPINEQPRSTAFRDHLVRRTNDRLGFSRYNEGWMSRHRVKFWRREP